MWCGIYRCATILARLVHESSKHSIKDNLRFTYLLTYLKTVYGSSRYMDLAYSWVQQHAARITTAADVHPTLSVKHRHIGAGAASGIGAIDPSPQRPKACTWATPAPHRRLIHRDFFNRRIRPVCISAFGSIIMQVSHRFMHSTELQNTEVTYSCANDGKCACSFSLEMCRKASDDFWYILRLAKIL